MPRRRFFDSDRVVERKRRALFAELQGTNRRLKRWIRRNPDDPKIEQLQANKAFIEKALEDKGENVEFEHLYLSLEDERDSPGTFLNKLAGWLRNIVTFLEKIGPIIDMFGGAFEFNTTGQDIDNV